MSINVCGFLQKQTKKAAPAKKSKKASVVSMLRSLLLSVLKLTLRVKPEIEVLYKVELGLLFKKRVLPAYKIQI